MVSSEAFASTPAEKWSPYLGESNIYVMPDGARWTHQNMYWRTGSKVEFDSPTDTFEIQTVFYDYDDNNDGLGDAFAREYYDTNSWQSNMPDPYLDTPWLNSSGIAGNKNEPDVAVGTFDPDVISANTWYYAMIKLKNTSNTESKYKISGQEGTSYFGCGRYCVDGVTSAVYIPFKSPFTAPENDRDYKYEWESNDTMNEAADYIEVNDWGTGTIDSSNDVDYWDFDVYVGQTINFVMVVPGNTSIDYDVKLYNSTGQYITGGFAGAGTNESFGAWLPAGHYYLKVYPYQGSDAYAQYHIMPYNSVHP